MRKFVAPFLSAALMLSAVVGVTGCEASAQIGPQPPPPPTAAPPPPPAKPVPPPPPVGPKMPEVKGGKVVLPGPVTFVTGSDVLTPESGPVLDVVVTYLNGRKDISMLRIEGHTDNVGKPDANLDLSARRAMSVVHYLTAHGIDCKRLIPVGFGQTKPIAGTVDKQTADEASQNRRVDFVNSAINGKPIGGMPVDGGGKVAAGDPCGK